MPTPSRPRRQETANTEQPSPSAPIRLFVRRGAIRRFDALKRDTAQLQVDVAWDRREGERRRLQQPVAGERRKGERRRRPSITWDLADFTVAIQRDK